MSGQFLAYPIKDDEKLKAIWEHSKSTPSPLFRVICKGGTL